ncbi:hypothetical protein ACIQVR_40925 [Streptomyces xanthochromogenes]|uniref:hypothetical protein n=1 Tax=Streptomyces xanthochromogenes TaxID=67384 RepID=UPI0037F9BC5F
MARGVIARYLTDAGKALADQHLAVEIILDESDGSLAMRCTACPYTAWANTDGYIYADYRAKEAEKRARGQAQAHAEKCRAMARPESD